MRVAYISADWSQTLPDKDGNPLPGGAGWYRCRIVADALRAAGHDVVHVPHLARRKDTGEVLPLTWLGETLSGYEIIVLQRWMHPEAAEVIKAARMFGQVVINDIDDWMDGVASSNAAFDNTHPRLGVMNRQQARQTGITLEFPANRNHYREALAASSLLTVSTPYLAERYAKLGRPVAVIRNAIDLRRWEFRERSEFRTVGWVGATSHRSGDLEILRGIIGPYLAKTGLRFAHSGHSSLNAPAAELLGLDDSQIDLHPQASIEEYPRLFDPLDIGVIPLRDVPFNKGKTSIKAMEMAASGVPFVASQLPEYVWFRQGWLARRPADWISGLNRMSDVQLRRELAASARRRVEAEDIDKRWSEWETVYSEARP